MRHRFNPIDPAQAAMRGTANALSISQGIGNMNRENSLRDFMGQNAGAVAQGDQGAINALATINPQFAMQAGQNAAANRRADAGLAISQERLQMVRDESARSIAREAAQLSAAEVAQQSAEIDRYLNGLASVQNPEQFERLKAQVISESPDYADDIGGFTFEDVPYLVGMLEGASEGLKVAQGPAPLSGPGKVQSDINTGILAPGTPLRNGVLVDMSGANFGPQPDSDGGLASSPALQSMPDNVDFSNATGASGFVSQLANTVSDAMGLGLVSPGNETATQAMQNLSTNTMIALADGVAGKPSNFLLQQFEKLSSQPNSIWQGEGRTRERLNQTRAMIEQSIMMNQDVFNTTDNKTMRSKAQANISRMSRLLADYDAVIESFGARGKSDNAVAPWMTDTDPATWSEEQMQEAERIWGLSK